VTIEVHNNQEAGQYEAVLDGDVVGHAFYRLDRDRVVFTHTEVSADAQGQGVASVLIGAALDDVRRHGKLAVPLCPFVVAFLKQHAEYRDLVVERYLGRVTP
jgi:uncharacterized protein